MEHPSCLNFSFQNTNSGYGSWIFGCFREFCNMLVLFMLFSLGMKILQLRCYFRGLVRFICEFTGKSDDLKNGFCAGSDVNGVCHPKPVTCKHDLCRFLKDLSPSALEHIDENIKLLKFFNSNNITVTKSSKDEVKEEEEEEEEEEEDVREGEGCEEDDEEDIVALRKAIRIQRERADAAYLELEKERMAAATATEEAMAMILRLQNEKSTIEIQAHQYRRLAEQKQLYDQEVIQSLRWIVLKHESERSLLESRLRLCRQRLKHYLDEGGNQLEGADQSFNSYSAIEDDLASVFVSSLDIDSSFM